MPQINQCDGCSAGHPFAYGTYKYHVDPEGRITTCESAKCSRKSEDFKLKVKDPLFDARKELFRAYGIEESETTHEQFSVLLEALSIFSEREKKYRNGWRSRGWKGNIVDVLRKCERIRSMFWDSEDFDLRREPDDLIDLLNYTVFAIRNARAGNRTGRSQS